MTDRSLTPAEIAANARFAKACDALRAAQDAHRSNPSHENTRRLRAARDVARGAASDHGMVEPNVPPFAVPHVAPKARLVGYLRACVAQTRAAWRERRRRLW